MFKEKILQEQIAVITGGGTGLGKEIAIEYARHGAKIVICSRKLEHLESGRDDIVSQTGAEVMIHQLDVREPNEVKQFADAVVDRFGRIDILVNNAAGNFLYPSEKLPIAGWKAVIDIVLNGTFYCSQIIGNQMIAQGGGQMINILATYAWHGGPGTVHSASAKAGVLAMTRTLAVEWARHNIRVNAIAPGPFDTEGARTRLWPTEELQKSITDEIPLNRFADLQEVARAVLYLTSPYASYITGECLVIDGGAWLGKGIGRIMDKVDQFAEMREASRRNRMGNK
ncbi:MAG: SDR family oxidoreductase [Calditrichaeota bacterium]|nr:SDR family oxidoreductase [Calditrichota bacterium]MCB0306550.1 SDR family oxidoreductase [Calditrichota bacterium]MCB9089887.1 SDR family oxidoreductase [Calditrichia bacterium]